MKLPNSERLLERAQALIPGGVNSPVRAYKSVGGTPPFIARGEGPYVFDEDGRRYVDLVLSYGPLILGHAHGRVIDAITRAAALGTTFGAPTRGEIEIAEIITSWFPSVEQVRLVNSGTEATMSAIRLARAATGRARILKFDGNYHGHGDSFLVKAGSGALTQGAPDSPGVPPALAELTLVADYNAIDSVTNLFERHGAEIAAVIVEPVAGNVGCVLPAPGFLAGLRSLCDRHGALLIFDEVMTGFRVARGGYQQICGVRPDLTTLGKVIGGGLPVGAYGGRRDLMQRIAPSGDVYQAGTLSGNPLAVAAGIATLRELDVTGAWEILEDKGAFLEAGLSRVFESLGVPAVVQRQGSMLCVYFAKERCTTLAQVMGSDRKRFTAFFHGMLERGVLLPPSPFECWFLSTAHDSDALDLVLDAARATLSGG
jgi:glutamate-1-semialdehyde 2,1-aminomutase